MSSEQIKPGFKQTELGVIPDEWEASTIGDNSMWLSGGTPSRDRVDYWSGTIPWISGSTLKSVELATSDQFLTVEGVSAGSKMAPLNSTLLLVRGSALHNEIRAGLVVAPVSFNQDVKALVPVRSLEPKFLTYYILAHNEDLLKLVSSAGNSAGVLDTELVQNFKFLKPPLLEQRSITTALSDVDALLAKLDQLIAKKRDLKQATMQQLLTGQTRLPGFSGDWEVRRLGRFLEFQNNGTFARADLVNQGTVKYLHYGDIHGSSGVFLDTSTNQMPFLPTEKARNLDRIQDGDLIFSDASEDYDGIGKSVEVKNLGEGLLVAGLHTIAVRFQKLVLADGFKAYLQFIPAFRNHLLRLASGTKVYATQRAHIASAELRLPPIDEQTAIATVLSDMDAELASLEARRDKTRALKQGMMQELLTGRIRLVGASESERRS